MGTLASQITSLTIVYSALYSGADQSKDQSSASLAFVWRIHRGPVNSPHKWPVTRKMSPFDDVIMYDLYGFRIKNYGILASFILKQNGCPRQIHLSRNVLAPNVRPLSQIVDNCVTSQLRENDKDTNKK